MSDHDWRKCEKCGRYVSYADMEDQVPAWTPIPYYGDPADTDPMYRHRTCGAKYKEQEEK